MLCDSGNFMGMEPQIQRMQNATGTRNAEEGFEMCGVVPHHGGYAVARLQSEFRQRRRKPARAPIEFAIAGARDGFVRLAGDDFDPREDLPRAFQDGGQRQRIIHHRAAHKNLSGGAQIGRIVSLTRPI